jgi:acyl-coenzyme A thioesterase PaaI-like protein
MAESLRTRLIRWGFNCFPTFRRSGARLIYIADDWREAQLMLPLNWGTRNYVGTIYGGSMYAAVEGIYMVMLMRLLGPEYIVRDKAGAIRYLRPGRATLYARFRLEEQEIATIRASLDQQPVIERVYRISLVDRDDVEHASIEKTIHIRRNDRSARDVATSTVQGELS